VDRKQQLIEQIKARAEQARQIAEKAEQDGWTAENRQEVTRLTEEAKEFKAQLDVEREGDDAMRQVRDMAADIGNAPAANNGGGGADAQRDRRPARRGRGRASLGVMFLASEQYQAFARQWPEAHIPDRARVNMDPVSVGSLLAESEGGESEGAGGGGGGEGRLISITGDIGGGNLVLPDFQGLVDLLGRPEVHLRDLVSLRTTSSDTIHFVRQFSRVINADWVPEATSIDDEDATKPMGGFDFEGVTVPVDTVAEWIPITKRAVMDAGQLRGLIDQELRGNLRDAEERALLYGGGGSGTIEGLDNTDGVQEQEFDTDLFTTLRKARTKVRFGGFAVPTAYLLNVEDDEKIDLERDEQGRFFGNGPFAMGPNSLWGLPRIVSQYVRPGEGWLADWRRAVIWDRQQATISVSDSHVDFFTKNLIAVLGEQREAFGVIRPSAFVKIETE
jgi:HK97 family phage major capsid protein